MTLGPGGVTATAANSPITVDGLTNGTPYTFTVRASNSVGEGPASSASNSVTPHGTVSRDFNGDGKADIPWRNLGSGENAVWLMNAAGLTESGLIPGVPDTTWRMLAVEDVDGDGKADIVWRNIATGDNAVWLMNGFTLTSSALIPTVADPAWTIVGASDFDGNGKVDILWRNTTTGDNAIWLMNGLNTESTVLIPGGNS